MLSTSVGGEERVMLPLFVELFTVIAETVGFEIVPSKVSAVPSTWSHVKKL